MRLGLPMILAAAAALLLGAAKPGDAVDYRVTPEVADGALRALDVRMSLRGDRDGQTRLKLPERWAEAEGLWRRIDGLAVEGGVLEPGDGPVRVVRHAPGARMEVRYRIGVTGQSDPGLDHRKGDPVVRPAWFMAHGEGLFAEVLDRDGLTARFAWGRAPGGWTLVSDLDHGAGRPVPHRMLVESVLVGATGATVRQRRVDGAPLRVLVLGEGWPFDPERFADQVARVVAAENRFWGDRGRPFLVTVTPLAGGAGGRYSSTGTGKGDAFSIESTTNLDLSKDLHFLAHEYMHTWIADEVGGLPQADEALEYWFSEGLTDHFASRVLLRSGLWTLEDYAAKLNEVTRRYSGSPARNATSAEVMAKFWSDQHAMQSAYDRGRLLGLVWDRDVQRATHGARSLDDVLRRQRRLAVRTPGVTGAKLFPRAMAEVAPGLDPAAQVARHVERGETLVVTDDLFDGCLTVAPATRRDGAIVQAVAVAKDLTPERRAACVKRLGG